ncbi:MAG: hypothetical protein ACE5HE_12730, partial [Phycisphaerae bacterium]
MKHPTTRRGLTMVELLLALAIAALVCMSVAAMLSAVSYGTSSERDLRDAVVRAKVTDARISSAIRGSRAILEAGVDYLVLWTEDSNPNGTANAPDLAEMRLVERDASNNLNSYAFPASWSQAQIDAANVSYSLTGNPSGFFRTATSSAKTAGSFQPTLWATNVTSIQFLLDGVDPVSTNLVSY